MTIKVLVSVNPVKSPEGKTNQHLFVIRNIFEYLFLLKQLIQERNFKEAILESILDGVFTVDSQFRITSFNKAAENITGYKKEEVLGKNCSEVMKSPDADACPLKKTLETGENVSNYEMEIITKNGKRIPVSVNTAILYDEKGEVIGGVETFRDMSEIVRLRNEVRHRFSFGNIIGKSDCMQIIYDKLEVISVTDSNVLIEGETGTGKDLIARTIHYNSMRKDKPFVKINCAAIPENLLESELFGYKKGAFTGAVMDKMGKFEAADGGTIFLDEIGDMPLSLQAKILRVIEEREFERLGEVETRKVDVRVIAATNRPLKELVEQGKFRMDLYYRLNVVRIRLPALRERAEDIPLLLDHFIEVFNKKFNKKVKGVEQRVMDFLLDYSWPGNVRELENVIEHAMIHARGDLIRFDNLPDYLFEEGESGAVSLVDVEREHILRVLKSVNNNKTRASKILGISRSTLWRKLKELNIE
ncbi:MAG TPA: PAS domain S-box protein [candidate division WOR-3 bacterium]|uniref:PAS domain S-box protein n=1 Tax=candidate division WOR-3 bacterium TaxID=2052148 RepID=A0A7C0ZI34_UNCW3|nr:PAS domain S-box protein [candidate division WOR-3 bacterium]